MTEDNRTQDSRTDDSRPHMFRAADQAVALISAVTPAEAALPTPCSEYDVSALAGHLLGVLGRVEHVARGGLPFDVPSSVSVPFESWAAEARERTRRVRDAWAADDVLDTVLHLPFGDVPGRGAALAYTEELTAHAWDLATALGRAASLDQELGAVALAAARAFIPDAKRGEIPFGPVVRVAEDAPVYDRLAAWLGRDPAWKATV